jgi:GT-D fold-like domain
MGSGWEPIFDEAAVANDVDRLVAELSRGRPGDQIRARFAEWIPAGAMGTAITARVRSCLTRPVPSSFIRLGDGEGNVLGFDDVDYPALGRFSASEISRLHFGASHVFAADPELRTSLIEAIRNADLVGVPNPFRIRRLLGGSRKTDRVRGLFGVYSVLKYLEAHTDDLRIGTKTGAFEFHRALLPHLHALVREQEIGLVCSYPNLPDAFQRRLGTRSVAFHAVPRVGRGSHDSGHYPLRYRELIDELSDAQPTRLYLVGAGMPGKVYCDVIRSAGGVALDIGSTMDVLAGVRSRSNITPEVLSEFQIVESAEAP